MIGPYINVETPNVARITINPSGKIVSFVVLTRTITISMKPKISEEEAIDIALSKFAKLTIPRESIPIKLSIEYMAPNKQMLTWIVEIKDNSLKLEDYPFLDFQIGGIVITDANTGEVLQVSEWR